MSSPKLIIIGGTTASGKSKLAVHIAKQIGGEVVSADSMQIYKRMDIGTAKVTLDEMDEIPHHMIDIAEPTDSFSCAEYKILAEKCIADIISRGKTPIVAGGTGLYISSIVYDMSYGGTEKNEEIRKKYAEIESQNGRTFLYNLLVEKDPESAKKLHENDVKRIIRALEIVDLGLTKRSDEEVFTDKYDIYMYGLAQPREQLYESINRRVDIMFESGIEKEVETLIAEGVTFDNQSMAAIGYREFKGYFGGEYNLDGLKELIKKNSRNYAKRQLTWFKRYKNIEWFNPLEDNVWTKKY